MRSEQAQARTTRLHPASLIFSIGSAARRLLIPGLVVLYAASRGGSGYEVWIMLLFVPAVIAALVRYWSLRYRLGREELVIREGIVTRNERHVPYQRIQNVDLVQNPLHRALGVAEVRIETAGGEKPEAVLRVLSLATVDQLRARVVQARGTGGEESSSVALGADPAATAGTVYEMSPKEVTLFGVISNQGMVVVLAVLGLLWQADLAERWLKALPVRETLENLPDQSPTLRPWIVAAAGLLLVLVGIVALRLLSVVWAFLKLYGFRLSRHGEDLRAEYGLLTRVSKTIPRGRIQRVSIKESVLHRWFGRVAIQVETAGGAGGEDEAPNADRLWLAPVIPRERAAGVIAEALPGSGVDRVVWEPLAPGARRRVFNRSLVVALLTGAGITALAWPWGAAALAPAVPAAWLNARLFVRHTGWAVGEGHVLFRSGWWVRRVSLAPFGKIQALELAQSPFDRRRRMASVRVDTAGGGRIGHRIAVPFLALPVAERLRDRLAGEAAATTFHW